MQGGRKRHDFPYGKPAALRLLEIAFLAVGFVWLFLFRGPFGSLSVAIPFVAGLCAIMILNWKLIGTYERTGQAVPIERRVGSLRFPQGMPRPMMAARAAFFVVVVAMLIFGFAAIPDSLARAGIVACVFALVGVAALNLSIERYYLNAGRAEAAIGRQYSGPITLLKAIWLVLLTAVTVLILWAVAYHKT